MSRNKVLKSTTIIPQELYVERAADRQLRQVVNDMGRPGYVLVARQMGKTNLLINMKRQIEGDGNLVVYFDLSNRSKNIKIWFRRIIDGIYDALPDVFDPVYKEITDQRQHINADANLEFERHLRLLLKAFQGRVIIILDEIDALVGSDFSDQVFAQIRSMYFSRVSHSEFNNLTYVLSGVAEPSDLIKDKNISPFNIGEKIYLHDFTKDEFLSFLERSKIQLSEQTSDAIYKWTGGNPRITWDLCSELEDDMLIGKSVDIGSVEAAVGKLYLTDFDRPPVDHIRNLVAQDKHIRNAVVEIKFGKGDALDDAVKRRLYLAGITGAGTGSNELKIKNEIIDQALSEKWFADLAKEQENVLSTAGEHYKASRFAQAITLYEDYMDGKNLRQLPPIDRLNFALACNAVKDFDGALDALISCSEENINEGFSDLVQYHIGVNLLMSGEPHKGEEAFRKLVDKGRGDYFHRSLVNLSSSCWMQNPDNYDEIVKLNKRLLGELSSPEAKKREEFAELSVTAHYNLARAYQAQGNFDAAKSELVAAISISETRSLPAVLLFLWELEREPINKLALMESAVATVIDSKLNYREARERSSLDFNKKHLVKLLECLSVDNRNVEFGRLLQYVADVTFSGKLKPVDVVAELWGNKDTERSDAKSVDLLIGAARLYLDEEDRPSVKLNLLRNIVEGTKGNTHQVYLKYYMETLGGLKDFSDVVDDDIILCSNIMLGAIQEKRFSTAREMYELLKVHREEASKSFKNSYALIEFVALHMFRATKDKALAIAAAQNTVELTDTPQNEHEVPDGYIASIRSQAQTYLKQVIPDPFRKIGRNTRVQVVTNDGSIIEDKFKKVEDQIRSGEFTLINNKADT